MARRSEKRLEGVMGLFFDMLFGSETGADEKKRQNSWEGMSSMFVDPKIKDYRDRWGSNNDHNWEADGDTRWDSYDD